MQPIRYQEKAGKPIHYGSRRIIPLSRSLEVRLPGFPGGLIWHRPVGVRVVEADGREVILPVSDKYRQFQLSMLGIGLLVGLIIALTSRNK